MGLIPAVSQRSRRRGSSSGSSQTDRLEELTRLNSASGLYVSNVSVVTQPDSPEVEALLTSEFAFVVLFGISVLEGAMLLRFMPSELVVPTALLLIGSSITNAIMIVLVTVIGTTIGQFLLFSLARRGDRNYVLQKSWFRMTEARLHRIDGWFKRWGAVAVPVSNTLLFVRGLLTVPAGLSDMDGRTFVVLSAFGSLSFQSILAGLYLLIDYQFILEKYLLV